MVVQRRKATNCSVLESLNQSTDSGGHKKKDANTKQPGRVFIEVGKGKQRNSAEWISLSATLQQICLVC